MHEDKCSVCLKSASKIVAVEEFGLDNIKYIEKLVDLIPEISWNSTHYLCLKCCGTLNESYEFKKLCLKSLENNELSDSESSKINQEEIIEDNELICYHCEGVFTSKLLLTEHIDQKHNITKTCKICGGRFSDQISLQQHLDDTHNIGETKQCPKCLKILPTSKLMKIHYLGCKNKQKKSKSKSSYTCTMCKNVFLTKYLLNRHIKNVHVNEKLFDCDVCGQKFASQVYLSAHKMYHSGERPHMCLYCGKSFITKSDLSHHEKIHANKRDYKCSECPKAFNNSSDLHKHRICVHFDKEKWKYVCNICNKKFPLKTNLDSHTKTHTGEKNFGCHICDRKCVSKSVLQRHIESHSNIRLFKCSECGLEYKYQRSLDVHLAKAHGIGEVKLPERVKKHFCHICPKSYYANNKLQKHIRSHTGEKPFQCLTCGKGFIDKSYIKQHMKIVHEVNLN
nr:zinc finger protein OZF-like [Onthophagus taurus]